MKYFDDQETRSPETREHVQFRALQDQISNAKKNAPYFTALLADVQPQNVKDRASLAKLPVTRKSDLIALQRDQLPFAGMTAIAPNRLGRIFASPGPIYDPQADKRDYWGIGRALFAAGFRQGDLVHNTFSYHFTPAGFMFDLGAQIIGCPVFPAGVGQTELQVQTIADLKPAAYTGTPSFLKILLEKADELKFDITSIKKASVGGEAFFPAQRALFAERGIEAYQSYGTADLGLIAYETSAREGMVADEGVILEIVRPGTGDPVPEGEVGEVVVTLLSSEYPLIRFATGDLSAVLPGISPCGRTNVRIKGWMGRADQTTKVRGMFVHPSQIADVLKRHPEVKKARLAVTHDAERNDQMTLRCEVTTTAGGIAESIAQTLRDLCKVRGEVLLETPGSLPNDGKVIEDLRKYD